MSQNPRHRTDARKKCDAANTSSYERRGPAAKACANLHDRFPFRQARSHYRNDFFHPASSGRQVRAGIRQSMPSSNIDSCAGVRNTAPSLALGQTKRPFSSRLREQAKTLPVPPQHLDQVAAAAAVDKQVTAERILGKMVLGQGREAIETAAQIGMPAGQPDMHIRRRDNHPRNPAITARNIATGVSRRIRTLPPDGRTTSIAAVP